jgi:hypothetical protein
MPNEWDAWVTAAGFSGLLLAVWWAARRLASRGEEAPAGGPAEGPADQAAVRYLDGVLALFGLLLAFTFSTALEQHHRRRETVTEDAAALWCLHECAGMAKEPASGRIQVTIQAYVDRSLELAHPVRDEDWTRRVVADIDALHDRLRDDIAAVLPAEPLLAGSLVDSYQDVVRCTAGRIAARQDRLPSAAFLVLVLAGAAAAALLGRQHEGARFGGVAAAGAFVALVGLVVWVTLDLNQPYSGWIRVSQEPLERLATVLR